MTQALRLRLRCVAHRVLLTATLLLAAVATTPSFAGDFDACGNPGSCFEVDLFGPGCEDPACCNAVCNVEPICCEIAWDKLCVALAEKVCNNCGSGLNSCFEVSSLPSCNDVEVCLAVCAVDPSCCETAWDFGCVRKAIDLCGYCGAPCAGECDVPHPDRPGCNDAACCSAVCLFDARCCEVAWDEACANIAVSVCIGCGNPGAGECCYENLTPFCNEGDCCETVCNIDTYCCLSRWDTRCAEEATALCGLQTCRCGVGGAEANCKAIHALPGCNDFDCCNDVCRTDPFCCAVTWDLACAQSADFQCSFNAACGEPGSGSCFIAHGTPGCDSPGCCDRVCRYQTYSGDTPFAYCCEISWDEDCVRAALEFCNNCGDVAAGSCYQVHGNANCNDPDCCNDVCLVDAFCCQVVWDDLCVAIARATCGDPLAYCGSPRTRPCLVPGGIGGCSDGPCCLDVCSTVDPYCCEVRWDQVCVAQASALCPNLLLADPGRGPCLEPHPLPGCSDRLCASAVCDVLPECCLLGWDSHCVGAARAICVDPDGGDGVGPCNSVHETTGCEDRSCESVVCFIDPVCCQISWDTECVSLANFNCNPQASWECPCEGSCLDVKSTPGCNDRSCCSGVCRIDPTCCEVEWDQDCVTIARAVCCGLGGCGDPCAGECTISHNSPGCSDAFCCESVCTIDPLCCSSSWDSLCVGLALARCTGGCGLPSSGSCYVAHPTPGCDDASCCGLVCNEAAGGDAFCCESEWDEVCRELAMKLCSPPECGDFLAGDCCVPHLTANCRDSDCCEAVCKIDDYCCDVQWDDACVAIARDQTQCQDCQTECGDPCAGDCCLPGITPNCNDGKCCEAICALDPFCCDGVWDEFCASMARQGANQDACGDACPLPPCGDPEAGSCCKPNPSPFCSDENCCETVCALDGFCCDIAWDITCALLASENCDELCGGGLSCGDPSAGPCDKPHPEPYCADAECCEFVCLLDATCCSVAWDEFCVGLADAVCSP